MVKRKSWTTEESEGKIKKKYFSGKFIQGTACLHNFLYIFDPKNSKSCYVHFYSFLLHVFR